MHDCQNRPGKNYMIQGYILCTHLSSGGAASICMLEKKIISKVGGGGVGLYQNAHYIPLI